MDDLIFLNKHSIQHSSSITRHHKIYSKFRNYQLLINHIILSSSKQTFFSSISCSSVPSLRRWGLVLWKPILNSASTLITCIVSSSSTIILITYSVILPNIISIMSLSSSIVSSFNRSFVSIIRSPVSIICLLLL